MRNLFDQYEQPENRLTHALMVALNEDRALLAGFIKWVTPHSSPVGSLDVIEQSWPRETEPADLELEECSENRNKKGLPDGCIHDNEGWALLIESKIAAAVCITQHPERAASLTLSMPRRCGRSWWRA